MKRSVFIFFKGLGLLFAILCGIGTAILGWFDGADWMNIVAYSIAVTGLILWGVALVIILKRMFSKAIVIILLCQKMLKLFQ